MNSSKHFYHISLISTTLILFLILASSTVSAATAQSSSPTITETQITTSAAAAYPAIYGDTIVWQDSRNGNFNSDIYMYNLLTKKETQISTSKSAGTPSIYGYRIVWVDGRDGYPKNDIYMYDLSTSKETRITNTGSVNYISSVEIYGDKIVWGDQRNGEKNDIYMYDLSTKKETQITTSGTAYGPDIYGDKIVWEDSRNKDDESLKTDIYMYDLSTKKETRITTSKSAGMAAIYKDKIVWRDLNDYKIHMYDLSTKKETKIAIKGSDQYWPDIYADRIVSYDSRAGSSDIYMYDLSNSKEIQVTTNKSEQRNPVIYGDKIVWEDYRNGNSNIFMGTITSVETKPKLPVASFSVSPTSGRAPLKVQFTDKSIGTPTSWKWSFGDGTYSTAKNPVHTYSKAGKYTVALTASNAAGSNTLKKSSLINVAAPLKAPIAAFLASPRSGKASLKVQFTDKSNNSPTSWKWSFGDKTYSTQKNPAHTYNKAGKYAVSLTVKNAKGSNTKTVSGYIIVK